MSEWNIERDTLPIIEFEDSIKHPSHYHQNGIDVIGFAKLQFSKEEIKGFHRINILKYVTRYDRKNGIEDLKKARNYLDMLIELESEKDGLSINQK